jgi:hypothetical protein
MMAAITVTAAATITMTDAGTTAGTGIETGTEIAGHIERGLGCGKPEEHISG